MKFKIGYLYEVKHKMQVLDYVLETLSIEEFPLSNKIETIRISGYDIGFKSVWSEIVRENDNTRQIIEIGPKEKHPEYFL